MSRGIAKKAYTYGRRNDMDMAAIAKYVEDAINSYNKMTPDMENAIKAIIDFEYPDESMDESSETDINKDSEQKVEVPSSNSSSGGLFDIKVLNDISDKMLRGSLKKVYMAGKRANKSTPEVVIDFNNYCSVCTVKYACTLCTVCTLSVVYVQQIFIRLLN